MEIINTVHKRTTLALYCLYKCDSFRERPLHEAQKRTRNLLHYQRNIKQYKHRKNAVKLQCLHSMTVTGYDIQTKTCYVTCEMKENSLA